MDPTPATGAIPVSLSAAPALALPESSTMMQVGGPAPRPEVIDLHCHAAGIGGGNSGCWVSAALRRSWRFGVYLKAFGIGAGELLRHGDALIIERLAQSLSQSRRVAAAVVLAMDGVVTANGELDRDRTQIYIPNAFVARECGRHPNLLLGASINPYRLDAVERLRQVVAEGAVLLKWLPSIQRIDPADRRLIPFYRQLVDLGLPLLSHTGSEHAFPSAVNELGDPERLRLPLSLGVTVIAAHAGGGGKYHGEQSRERFLRLAREYGNLHADLSALTQLNRLGHLPWLLRQPELHGRLCHGSDMPLPNTALVSAWGYLLRLPLARILAINRLTNTWDRDVALKEALGVTPEMLRNGSTLVRRPSK